MKAHDLAKKLLALPDYEVLVCGTTFGFEEGNFSTDIHDPVANEMHNEDGSVEMVVIIDLKFGGE
jgi:hypothetical protein